MGMKINPVLILALISTVLVPAGLTAWWKKRNGIRLWCFAAGAICFFIFALVLERMLHAVCITGDNSISRTILSSPVFYTLYAALAAGIFEETGRLFGYRILLRKERAKACAAAYGIGHGGTEVLLLVSVNYLILLLAQAGMNFGAESVMTQLRSTADAITLAGAGVALIERISAMMVHIGLSMIMFVAARQKGKLWLYPAAVLLHALTDIPAALFQYQGRQSIALIVFVEIYAFLCGIFCLLMGKKLLAGYEEPEAEHQQ